MEIIADRWAAASHHLTSRKRIARCIRNDDLNRSENQAAGFYPHSIDSGYRLREPSCPWWLVVCEVKRVAP
jgi:hypothetical protein